MFFVDDLLFRALGVSLPGLDLIWTMEQVQKFANREMYNPEKIKNQIKENRMFYEFGELTRAEYEQTNSELMQKLRIAELAEDMNLGTRTDILG